MKNYTVIWTWNREFDNAMNIQQAVIPDCKNQQDAEQKAFEYMHDVWIDDGTYSDIQSMVDDRFASFMVTSEEDMKQRHDDRSYADGYCRNHAYKYWRGKWENPIEGLVDPMLDELQSCGYFDELEQGHYLGYKNLFDLPHEHEPIIVRKEIS